MFINGSKLLGCPVLSLHVGGKIAQVTSPIIDPNNLKIIAYKISGPMVGKETGDILRTEQIREFSDIGMIVDSSDDFVFLDDVVRLKEVAELNFNLVGLKVETKKGSKLGKVLDYMVETSTFQIMQIIVKRPTLKALVDPELLISFSQIAEITDYKVIVKSEEEKLKKAAMQEDFVPNFVNPFREQHFAPVNNQNPDLEDTEWAFGHPDRF